MFIIPSVTLTRELKRYQPNTRKWAQVINKPVPLWNVWKRTQRRGAELSENCSAVGKAAADSCQRGLVAAWLDGKGLGLRPRRKTVEEGSCGSLWQGQTSSRVSSPHRKNIVPGPLILANNWGRELSRETD